MNLGKTPTTPPDELSNSGTSELGYPIRPRGLVSEIVELLSRDIQSGVLKPGEKLPTEAIIMRNFAVSRTVVREALSRLQASHMVITKHGIGTFVAEQTAKSNFSITPEDFSTLKDVISILELRISLETEAAGLAAKRRTPENIESMRKALKELKDSISSPSGGVASDFEFHIQVAKATGNRHFSDLMNHLGTMIIPRGRISGKLRRTNQDEAYLLMVNSEHESIFHAIVNEDSETARAAMRTHLTNSRDRLIVNASLFESQEKTLTHK
jgi:GntR family transcriptional regulator, transcriptional repressor for pyruvate dehydrogenase complex